CRHGRPPGPGHGRRHRRPHRAADPDRWLSRLRDALPRCVRRPRERSLRGAVPPGPGPPVILLAVSALALGAAAVLLPAPLAPRGILATLLAFLLLVQ